MNKQFLSLSLLLSTAAFAGYDVVTTIAVADHRDSYEWNSDEVLVAENNQGIVIESRVTESTDETVVINVTVTKRSGEQTELLQSSDAIAQLGQEVSVKCPTEGVEASISFVVTKQAEIKTESPAQDEVVANQAEVVAQEESVEENAEEASEVVTQDVKAEEAA